MLSLMIFLFLQARYETLQRELEICKRAEDRLNTENSSLKREHNSQMVLLGNLQKMQQSMEAQAFEVKYAKGLFFKELPNFMCIFTEFEIYTRRCLRLGRFVVRFPGRVAVAIAATFLRNCVADALSRGDGPATCYTLRRNTARKMKI